jgi:acyl-CoA synthetase (AMP-forming)/AMP-acid ligase II
MSCDQEISAVFHVSSRRDSRSQAANGQSAGRANLLVRATDGILGTHKPKPVSAVSYCDLRRRGSQPGRGTAALLGMTLPQALEWAASAWGDKVAFSFVHAPDTLTYAELASSVARIRTGLTTRGLRPGERVGIMIPNQVEFPLAWLSVIDSGAVAVPVNPRYTQREIEFVLADAGATWLIVTDDILARHEVATFEPVPASHVVATGAGAAGAHRFSALLGTPAEPRLHQADQDDLVGIQFTSGSTGLPKGCVLTHNYWLQMGIYGGAVFHDPQHMLADHPFYYMQNQAYFMHALAGGGQLHVTPGLSRSKFMSWLLDYDIDFAWISEGMLNLAKSEADGKLKLKFAPVDAIPPDLHRPLEERFHLKAREFYASTEVGGGTFVPWDRDDLVGSGSMGLCFPNRESKIVDANLDEVPPGRPGEMLIRGPGMMLGYWNRPETNAQLMLPDGWFRTGDVVRKDADGLHYYVGRTRDIVRRSGENISAVEVEQQLKAMPQVIEVAVLPVPDPSRGEEVKAVLVMRAGSGVTAQDVIDWARQRLAPFKVPRYIELRSQELPRTGSGKIDKVAIGRDDPMPGTIADMTISDRVMPPKPATP